MAVKKKRVSHRASIGSRIVAGLTDFRDALKNREPVTRKFTVRTVELDLEPQPFSPGRMIRIRNGMGASQAVFAQLIGVSVFAVQSWEHGKREPSRMARRLLDEMDANPGRWIEILRNANIKKTGSRAG